MVGKYDAAIEDFNATLNVDNRSDDAWAGLGLAYERQGNRAKAVESYQRALVVDTTNKLARDGLARLGVRA
jgi:tetratricopeptide (TPR) repeat protein